MVFYGSLNQYSLFPSTHLLSYSCCCSLVSLLAVSQICQAGFHLSETPQWNVKHWKLGKLFRSPISAAAAAAAAESLQSCLTLCNPTDGSPPGSLIPGILQARTLEWVAISFSNAWKWKVKVKSLSRVWPSATLWTAAYQAPPSMGFSRQEYWSGVPLPSPDPLLLILLDKQ